MSRHFCCKACEEGGPLALWPTELTGSVFVRPYPPRADRDHPEGRYWPTQRGWIEALGISSAIAES